MRELVLECIQRRDFPFYFLGSYVRIRGSPNDELLRNKWRTHKKAAPRKYVSRKPFVEAYRSSIMQISAQMRAIMVGILSSKRQRSRSETTINHEG